MTETTVSCDSCGTINPSQAVFCNACGQPCQSLAGTEGHSFNNLLNNRYLILEQVGQGGFGCVYKAADTSFGNRLVAVKAMEQKGLSVQEIAEATSNFKREALLLAHLRHPHLPRIYDHFSDAGRWYLVMDYIEGETLENHLQKVILDQCVGKQQLEIAEVLEIGLQLCLVLDYLHTRQPPIIFRDLKPANVMRTYDGHLYLIDFGIARHFKQGQSNDTMPLGSPGYAAPEQYGKTQTTQRADIYSLGVTLHQLLTGDDPTYMPFRLAPIRSHDQKYIAFDALLKRMTSIDENDRPAVIATVKAELQQIAQLESGKRVWKMPQEYPATPIFTDDSFSANSSQQIFAERKQELEQPVGPDRSRRKVLFGLAGLGAVALGISAWQSFFHYEARPGPMGVTPIKAPLTQKPLIGGPLKLQPFSIYLGHAGAAVTSASWSPDGKRIASSGMDGSVQVWDALTGKNAQTYNGQIAGIGQVIWSPDGTKIASASLSGAKIQERSASTGELLYMYEITPANKDEQMLWKNISWSPDGKYLAAGVDGPSIAGPPTQNGRLQIWNTTSRQLVHAYPCDTPEGIAWSPDPNAMQIAINTTFGQTIVIDTATGTQLANYQKFGNSMESVAWSPDGKYVASASDNGTVQVWEPGRSNPQAMYVFSHGAMHTVAWSPDGKSIASGSSDGRVMIWDAFTGDHLIVHQNNSETINSVQWSPDGQFVVSASNDQTVCIWKASA